MFSSFWQQKGIGIVSNKDGLLGAVVSLNGKKIHIEQLFDERTQDETNVKPLDILRKEKQAIVVSGIDTSEMLIRSLSLPLKKKKDIDAVLPFEAEPLLPFPIDEAILQGIIHNPAKNLSEVTLFVTRKSNLSSHLAPLHNRGVEPDLISAVPYALATFAQQIPNEHPFRFIVCCDLQNTSCVLTKNGTPIAAFSIAESLQNLSRFRPALTQTLFSLRKTGGVEGETDLLFCGPQLPKETTLREWEKDLPYPITPFAKIEEAFNHPSAIAFPVPIGFAIQAVRNSDSPNFRRKEFTHPKPWRKNLLPLSYTAGLSLLLALSIHLFGLSYLNNKERAVQQEYLDLLSDLHYSHEMFEKEFFPQMEEEIISVENLSKEEIELRLFKMEKEVNKNSPLFPLFPQTPRVADVFAWFLNHPKVISINPETGERCPLLQLESFSYTMVKRPEISKPKEKYQVKVDLEFSTETPKFAREFHDALIAPNEIVDPKNEVKWSSQRGKYRTSFYLKDKTTYYTEVTSKIGFGQRESSRS